MTKYSFDPTLFTLASDPAKASAYIASVLFILKRTATTELHVSMVVQRGRVEVRALRF